jgi:hypothetical protein
MFLTKQGASSRALPKHKERAVLPEKPEPELELVEKEPYQRGPYSVVYIMPHRLRLMRKILRGP